MPIASAARTNERTTETLRGPYQIHASFHRGGDKIAATFHDPMSATNDAVHDGQNWSTPKSETFAGRNCQLLCPAYTNPSPNSLYVHKELLLKNMETRKHNK